MVKNSEMRNVIIRPANQCDIPQLVALMNSEYTRKKTKQYFIWQFFESVYPTVLMTASVGNRIIGMFGLQKRMLNNGTVVGQVIDMLIDKKWRGKGLFSMIANKALEFFDDLDLLVVLPNRNGKFAVQKSLGWKCISKIDTLSLEANKIKGGIYIKYSDNSEYNDLYSFEYNTEILQWRFDKHPLFDYNYTSIDNGDFSVTKVFEDPVSKKRIGDIVYLRSDGNNLLYIDNLLRKTIQALVRESIDSVTTWALPHTSLYQVARSIGFKEVPQERYYCIKTLSSELSHLENIDNWHLIQADAEIY